MIVKCVNRNLKVSAAFSYERFV